MLPYFVVCGRIMIFVLVKKIFRYIFLVKNKLKARLLKWFYFENEQALLKGKIIKSIDRPSVVFFTVHKAASSLLSQRLSVYFNKHGYLIADLSSFFAKTGMHQRRFFLDNTSQRQNVFKHKGVFHCSFRYYVDIPQLSAQKILLVLRDPRDVLVSHYFSTLFSHPVHNIEFLLHKENALNLDIDDYVKTIAPEFLVQYLNYMELRKCPNVLCLLYEDMVNLPATFEQSIANFVDLPLVDGEIVHADDFIQEKENKYVHKRKVTPGDHREKLKPETVLWLNDFFQEVLIQLNYSI